MATPSNRPLQGQVSDYLASIGTAKYEPFKITGTTPTGTASNGDASGQDFLSWLGDILSRPEFAVTETISSAMDLADKSQKFDPLSAAGHVLSAPFRGFFSTAKEDKPYGSDLLAQMEALSRQDNPDYKPEAISGNAATDAVTGIAKFTAGLGLDIALDPLTYITFGGSAAAKAAAKAAKGAEAAKTVEVTNAGVKAAEQVAPDAAKVVTESPAVQNGDVTLKPGNPTPVIDALQGTETTAPKQFSLTIFEGKKPGRVEGQYATEAEAIDALNKLKAGGGKWVEATHGTSDPMKGLTRGTKGFSIAKVASEVPDTLREIINTTVSPTKMKEGRSLVDTIVNGFSPEKLFTSATPLSRRDFARNMEDLILSKSTNPAQHALSKGLLRLHDTFQAAPPAVQEQFMKLAEVIDTLRNGTEKFTGLSKVSDADLNALLTGAKKVDPNNTQLIKSLNTYKKALKDIHALPGVGPEYKSYMSSLASDYQTYLEAFKLERNQGKAINILGQTVEDINKLSARETFTAMMALDSTIINRVFGPETAKIMKRSMTPEAFDNLMESVKNIFYKQGALDDNIVLVGPASNTKIRAQEELLRYLGIDLNYYYNRVTASRTILRDKTEEQIAEQADKTLLQAIQDIPLEDEALASAMGIAGMGRQARYIMDEIVPEVLSKFLPNFDRTKRAEYIAKTTDKEILRTSEVRGEGIGLDPNRVNTYKMSEALGVATEVVSRDIEKIVGKTIGKGIGGESLANLKYRYAVAALRIIDAGLRSRGAPLVMDLGKDFYHLSLADAMDTFKYLADEGDVLTEVTGKVASYGSVAKNAMYMMFFNADTAVPPTLFADAIATALKGGTPEEIRAVLSSTKTREGKKGNFFNFFATKEPGRYMFQPNGTVKKVGAGAKVGKAKESGTGNYIEWDPQVVLEQVTQLIAKNRDTFAEVATKNFKTLQQQIDADTTVLSSELLNWLDELSRDPSRYGELFKFVANPAERVGTHGAAIGASDSAVAATTAKVGATVGQAAQKTAKNSEDVGDALKVEVNDATNNAARVEENLKAGANAAEDAAHIEQIVKDEELVPKAEIQPYDTTIHSKTRTAEEINATIFGRIHQGLNRFFNPEYGLKNNVVNLFRMYRDSFTLHRNVVSDRINSLRAITQKYDKETVVNAFRALQEMKYGNVPSNPKVAEAYKLLARHMSDFFDVTDSAVLSNPIFRQGVGIEYINRMLKQYDVLTLGSASKYSTDLIDLDLAQRMVATGQADNLLDAAASMWRTWKVNDPIDFIQRLDLAAAHMATDVAVVTNFVREGRAAGFISSKPIKGYVQLVASKKNRYTELLPADIYVDPEVAKMFNRLEEISQGGSRIPGSIGHFIHNYFDPIQNAWKVGMTINRPGHHIRNGFGDQSMTFVAEGPKNFMTGVKDSFKILSVRGTGPEFSPEAMLNSLGETKVAKGGDVLVNGHYGKMTNEQMYKEIFGRGLLSTTNLIEDVYPTEAGVGVLSRIMDALTFKNTAYHRGMSKWSEFRDHQARIQHFMQIIHNEQAAKVPSFTKVVDGKKVADTKALFDFASDRVMKFHPDVTLLTKSEQYLRRVIPFYSWVSRAIPSIAAATMTNPGRVMMFNKASYNAAVAAGINPDSLYDPFPEDQMFPSFVTNKAIGPQWEFGKQYWGINPGIATWDIQAMLAGGLPGANPDYAIGTALSPISASISPFLSIPIELMAGSQLDSGSRIKDYSDYVDSQLPGANYISSISGYSPTGSLLSLIQGKGLDPNYQTFKENRGPADQVASAVNFLTGLGVTNYSRPNYVNLAEIEKRNREAAKENTRSAF